MAERASNYCQKSLQYFMSGTLDTRKDQLKINTGYNNGRNKLTL